MIRKDNKDVTFIAQGTRAVQAVYKGVVLVWQSVRACFGSGAWIDGKPWLNNENWKNNK